MPKQAIVSEEIESLAKQSQAFSNVVQEIEKDKGSLLLRGLS